MAGIPAFNMNPVELQGLNPVNIITTVRAFYRKWQSAIYLLASGILFCFSSFCKSNVDSEGMYFLDVYLVSLVLTLLPRPIVTARQRIVAQIGEWGFAFMKGICSVAFFTLFQWLGKKLLDDKDIFIALSCILFFAHILFLRVIHEITDDVGIAQGVLVAGYTVLISEYPNLPHIICFSAAFTILLAIVNTPQPPYQPPYQEIEMDEADQPPNSDDEYDDAPEQVANPAEDLEVGHEGPVNPPPPAIPLQPKGNWAEAQNSKWTLAHTTKTRCKLI